MISATHGHEPAVPSVRLGGVAVSRLNFRTTMACLEAWLEEGPTRRIATANLEFLRLVDGSTELKRCLAGADLVTADGMPLVWMSHLTARPIAGRAAGSDLLPALLELAAQRGHRVYFLGGAAGTARIAAANAVRKHPNLQIAGADGPRVDLEDIASLNAITAEIRQSQCDLLLVGLGCPKQELFLERHMEATGAQLGIGLGGSFDFSAGRCFRAPRWLRKIGLEWAWRLAQEPTRLAGRYAKSLCALPKILGQTLTQNYCWKDVTP